MVVLRHVEFTPLFQTAWKLCHSSPTLTWSVDLPTRPNSTSPTTSNMADLPTLSSPSWLKSWSTKLQLSLPKGNFTDYIFFGQKLDLPFFYQKMMWFLNYLRLHWLHKYLTALFLSLYFKVYAVHGIMIFLWLGGRWKNFIFYHWTSSSCSNGMTLQLVGRQIHITFITVLQSPGSMVLIGRQINITFITVLQISCSKWLIGR